MGSGRIKRKKQNSPPFLSLITKSSLMLAPFIHGGFADNSHRCDAIRFRSGSGLRMGAAYETEVAHTLTNRAFSPRKVLLTANICVKKCRSSSHSSILELVDKWCCFSRAIAMTVRFLLSNPPIKNIVSLCWIANRVWVRKFWCIKVQHFSLGVPVPIARRQP